jgi:hypothetical protein
MSYVGKVLIVVQVVLSLCFMAFAGAVYTVQTNWKEKAEAAEANLQQQRSTWTTAEENYKAQVDELTTQRDQARNEADGAKAQADLRGRENDLLKQDLESTRNDLEAQRALALTKSTEAEMWREELMKQRVENRKLHEARNDLIVRVRRLEDDLFGEERRRTIYTQKHRELLDSYATVRNIIRHLGFSENPQDYPDLRTPPPEVVAHVLNTRRNRSNGVEYVEISIGSDDGVTKGHDVYVYRSGDRPQYLGRIRLVEVSADRAVGELVERSPNGVIQKGDNVTTKL